MSKTIYNGRLFNPPPGEGKTHNIGSTAGLFWRHPGIKYDPEKETFVTEGIINALSLIELGYQAIAILSAGQAPARVDLSDFPKLVFAFDPDEAGKKALRKWTEKYPNAKAVFPLRGDWNDLLTSLPIEKAKTFFLEKRAEFEVMAKLALAKTASYYATIFEEFYQRPPDLFAFHGCFYFSSKKKTPAGTILVTDRVSNFTLDVRHYQLDTANPEEPVNRFYLDITPRTGRPVACSVTAQELATSNGLTTMFRQATGLYPGGLLIEEDHLHHQEAVQSTRKWMQDVGIPAIYEGAFLFDDIRVRTDVIERTEQGKWNLIEVKSSTSVKDIHKTDLAVQYYVLRGAGVEVDRTCLLYLNNQYVFDGHNLDLEQLFNLEDLTYEVLSLQGEIPAAVARMKEVLRSLEPPEIAPSRHCKKPYECDFWEHCRARMPQFWVLGLYGISQQRLEELAAGGIEDIRDVPDLFPLSALQERIRRCVVNEEEFLDPQLARELRDIKYPIHFFDFETISPAVPRYAGTRPYHTIPFQWSDHILHEDGTLEHLHYLYGGDRDPLEEGIRTLTEALGVQGTIFTYTTYEKDVLNSLIEGFPQYGQMILPLMERFKDLCALISQYFYNPLFHGSFSLKAVLPVLVPSLNYHSLTIQDGMAASFEYLRMIDPATTMEEKLRIREGLLTYCGYDTLGMVKIRDALLGRLSNPLR
jgi:predicted RecB family nuclease